MTKNILKSTLSGSSSKSDQESTTDVAEKAADVKKDQALKQLMALAGIGAAGGFLGRALPSIHTLLMGKPPSDPMPLSPRPIQFPVPHEEPQDQMKMAGLSDYLPDITTTEPLGDIWGPSAAFAAIGLPAFGAYKLTDYALDKERKARGQSNVEKAKREFYAALQSRYRNAMQAKTADDAMGVDDLYEHREQLAENIEKSAENPVETGYELSWGNALSGLAPGLFGNTAHDAWRRALGYGLATVLATGAGSAALGYNMGKKRDPKVVIDKALQERARKRMHQPSYALEPAV